MSSLTPLFICMLLVQILARLQSDNTVNQPDLTLSTETTTNEPTTEPTLEPTIEPTQNPLTKANEPTMEPTVFPTVSELPQLSTTSTDDNVVISGDIEMSITAFVFMIIGIVIGILVIVFIVYYCYTRRCNKESNGDIELNERRFIGNYTRLKYNV